MNSSKINSTLKKYFLFLLALLFVKNNAAQTCNNWLKLPSYPSYMDVPEIDVPGTEITVEALFVRTTPYTAGEGYDNEGDIVSKHYDPSDVNYLLRPNHAYITTTNGFFSTPDVCPIELNKVYHVAMVYDGSTLKFYRNGFLLSQTNASGNLFQNDDPTRIGLYIGLITENLIGYINEVRIWNVARSQSQIRNYMNTSLPSPTTQTGLLAYYIFDNLLNKQGNSAYNGQLVGSASINQTNPFCSFVADSCGNIECGGKTDFSIKQDACSPYSIQLSTNEINYNSIKWNFGDGSSTMGSSNISYSYTTAGTYTIEMIKNFSSCSDTITKKITIGSQFDNYIIQTEDTTICSGNLKQLKSSAGLSYCWSPATYLDNPKIQNPVTSAPNNITYYLTTQATGNNLVTNGDFSNGNSDFTSSYIYSPTSGIYSGAYNVGSNISAWNAGLSNCKDHTTSSGNMLMVNGAVGKNLKIWSQTIPITRNTIYVFSAWVQSLSNTNPASLQFSINGVNQGSIYYAGVANCTWERNFTLWNSGDTATAVISIVNQDIVSVNNDFALDDIFFAPVFLKTDSVQIIVANEKITASNNVTVCQGETVQLSVSGGSSFVWSPPNSLSSTTTVNPKAAPATTTKYYVTGITPNGCNSKDSVTVFVHPKPVINKTADTSICSNTSVQLNASGGVSYLWSPSSSLSNAAIANPIATPTQNTIYKISVTNNNNCVSTDSVKITIKPEPVFTISPLKDICEKKSILLSASGGNIYHWEPASSLDNPNIASPLARPIDTTTYTVNITETTCNKTSILSTTINVLPLPSLQTSKTNDIDCSQNYSQLNVVGANTYVWFPALTLNASTISNPLAYPLSPTMFYVTGTNNSGCSSTDSIFVDIKNINQGLYLMPNAFTPNNDGLNDCYGIKSWGILSDFEFSIYNRWGQQVFFTTNQNHCWDGTYKGVNQNPDTYQYLVKAKSGCAGTIIRKGNFVLIR